MWRDQGRVREQVFAATLLADRGLVLDRSDVTQATDNPTPEADGIQVFDRSLMVLSGVLLPPFMDYVRNDLGYVTDRAHVPPDLVGNAAWDRGGPEDMGIALAQNLDLRGAVGARPS